MGNVNTAERKSIYDQAYKDARIDMHKKSISRYTKYELKKVTGVKHPKYLNDKDADKLDEMFKQRLHMSHVYTDWINSTGPKTGIMSLVKLEYSTFHNF
jgi:hypothetical protein